MQCHYCTRNSTAAVKNWKHICFAKTAVLFCLGRRGFSRNKLLFWARLKLIYTLMRGRVCPTLLSGKKCLPSGSCKSRPKTPQLPIAMKSCRALCISIKTQSASIVKAVREGGRCRVRGTRNTGDGVAHSARRRGG